MYPCRRTGARRHGQGRRTPDADPGSPAHAYLVPASGVVEVGGISIEARDGAAIIGVGSVEIFGIEDAEVVRVDAA